MFDLQGYGWMLWEGVRLTIAVGLAAMVAAVVLGLIGAWGKLGGVRPAIIMAQFVNRMRHLVTAAARQARSLAPGARPTRWNQLR